MPATFARQMEITSLQMNVIEGNIALQDDAQLIFVMTMPIRICTRVQSQKIRLDTGFFIHVQNLFVHPGLYLDPLAFISPNCYVGIGNRGLFVNAMHDAATQPRHAMRRYLGPIAT